MFFYVQAQTEMVEDIRSFSIKNSNISLNNSRSKMLLHIGSKDIGR